MTKINSAKRTRYSIFLPICLLLLFAAGCASAASASEPYTMTPEVPLNTVGVTPLQSSPVQISTPAPSLTVTGVQLSIPPATATSSPASIDTPTIQSTVTVVIGADWYTHPDFDLSQMPYSYALEKHPGAPVYSSLFDAIAHSKTYSRFSGQEVYVSYIATRVVDGVTYYQLDSDKWMDGADLEPLQVSTFSGLILSRPVDFSFGWVLKDSYSISTPGSYTPQGVGFYPRYSVVRLLSANKQGGQTWYRIADGEWLPADSLSVLNPDPNPPEGVNRCRWIAVNLEQQNLAVYDNCKLVFATLISSGRDDGWTGTGVHPIYSKLEFHDLLSPDVQKAGDYYLENVPWLLFYAGPWALHGAYWHDNFGKPWSHGCINLSLADAHWLYIWAVGGDLVYIGP